MQSILVKINFLVGLIPLISSTSNKNVHSTKFENFFNELRDNIPDTLHPVLENSVSYFSHMLTSNMASWTQKDIDSFESKTVHEISPGITNQLDLLNSFPSIQEALQHIFGTLEENIRVFPYTEIAKKWAPKLVLAKGENYFPSSVDFFLRNVVNYYEFPEKDLLNVTKNIKGPFTLNNLPSQKESQNNNGLQKRGDVVARDKYRGVLNVSIISPVLYGQNLVEATTYTLIQEKGRVVRITYWFFYPYNKGKYGSANHIGDWEHVSLKLVKLIPKSIKFSVHDRDITLSKGGFFKWDGLQFKNKKETLSMDGTHPVVYVAYGSHGHWSRPGRFLYKTIFGFIKLHDICSDGEEWRTWENMKVVLHRRTDENYLGESSFLNYKGHWGNYGQGNCNLCPLKNGPLGPTKLDPFIYT